MKRSLLFTGVLMLAAQVLCAASPSARTEAAMVYNPKTTHSILFGGATATDSGTRISYLLDQTWEWTGARWVQRFPATVPSGRSSPAMVFDTTRSRVVMFGGHTGVNIQSNDTWIYQDDNWVRLDTPNAPSTREIAAATYDPIRDRVILFGGFQTSVDGKVTTNLNDTWEFDGTTWTQRAATGPVVVRQMLQYDPARNQVILVAMDKDLKTLMYRYDPAAGTWTPLTPTTLPLCVNQASLDFQTHNNTVLLIGGSCNNAQTVISDEAYEWDGTNWTKTTAILTADRHYGMAAAYDEARRDTVLFGGTLAFGTPQSETILYRDGGWIPIVASDAPAPRSLFGFESDPVNNAVWLVSGSTDNGVAGDLWKYQNGQFTSIIADNAPSGCLTPNTAFDTDRKKLVVLCASSDTFEWDGTAWTSITITDSRKKPTARRFSSMVYDQTLKKTVLFGGFNDPVYLDETWTFDGTSWSQVTKNRPTSRSLHSMWFDPTLKKTVIYGGIGRLTSEDRITRYSDMWTFDGSGWTVLAPPVTPGIRYGAQTAIDPRSNRLLLFGGLRVDTNGTTQTQVYADDTWQFDGTTWKQLTTATVPPARENGGLAYDPSQQQMVLFAGYAGSYLSDLWLFNGTDWSVRSETLRRRRVSTTPSGLTSPVMAVPSLQEQ
jgi:hypothetical protein